jgi:membrane-bound metal-dependent hydrolase YbcI (DUF457 family)
MPFTPFHMGPGLAVKSVSGRHFSLLVFGFSQVAIDLEPLVRIIRGDSVLHGFTHTYLGATLIGLASVLVGRPVCQFFLNFWVPDESSAFLYWLRGPRLISWPAAVAGAFVGTYSHIILDSIMHSDMQPFAPLSESNSLLHVISVAKLHLICMVSGLCGALLIFLAFYGRRSRSDV